MVYKITFADDSTACLAHFGVKGMHWGVWNEETRRRHTGGGNSRNSSQSSNSSGSVKRKGLSEGQKRALKTAAVGVGVAAAVGGGAYLGRKKALKSLRAGHIGRTEAARIKTSKAMKDTVHIHTKDMLDANKQFGLTKHGAKYQLAQTVKGSKTFSGDPRVNLDAQALKYLTSKYKAEVAGSSKKYKRGKAAVTALGITATVGSGVGSAYAYNRSSKKRNSKK